MKIAPVLFHDEAHKYVAQLQLLTENESPTIILESCARTSALAEGHLAVDVRGFIEALYDLPETRVTMLEVIKQRKAKDKEQKESAA